MAFLRNLLCIPHANRKLQDIINAVENTNCGLTIKNNQSPRLKCTLQEPQVF